MRWVKAADRLPEFAGRNNKVVIRTNGDVAYGFKNFNDENPKIYYEDAGKSYLGNEGIEWLDESSPSTLADINDDLLADLRNKLSPMLNLAQMVVVECTHCERHIDNIMLNEAKRVIDIINIITQKPKPDVSDQAH